MPKRRIRNARRKLDGFSPVALLVDDLKQNPAVDKFNSPGRARGRPAARVNMIRSGRGGTEPALLLVF